MEITIYNFSKKVNSTAIPGEGVEDIVIEGVVKTPFDLVHPSVDFNLPITSNVPAYFNYAYIPFLRRYYHINTWVWSGRLWHAEMTCDVLASFKTDIGNSTEYVLRAESMSNGYLVDNSVPTTGKITLNMSPNTKPEGYGWTGDYNNGSFVVGIINTDNNSVGSVSYYKFTSAQFRNLARLLLGGTEYLNIDDLSEGVQKALVNPWQYITSCCWFPFDVAAGESVSSVSVGWWSFSVSCSRIASYGYSRNDLEFSIYKHPKTYVNGKYVGLPPFSEYTLYIPGFGAFDIPPQYLIDENILSCQIVTDSISGLGTLVVRAGTKEICVRSAQIGVYITLAGSSISDPTAGVIDIAGKLLNSLAPGISEQSPASFISRALMGYAAASTNISTSGGTGTLSEYYFTPYLKCVFADQPEIASSEIGKPLCAYVKISTLSGYVQCAHGEINTTATETEKEMIKKFLEGGFYYA